MTEFAGKECNLFASGSSGKTELCSTISRFIQKKEAVFKLFTQVLVILSRVRVFGESTLAIFGALTAQHVGVK